MHVSQEWGNQITNRRYQRSSLRIIIVTSKLCSLLITLQKENVRKAIIYCPLFLCLWQTFHLQLCWEGHPEAHDLSQKQQYNNITNQLPKGLPVGVVYQSLGDTVADFSHQNFYFWLLCRKKSCLKESWTMFRLVDCLEMAQPQKLSLPGYSELWIPM